MQAIERKSAKIIVQDFTAYVAITVFFFWLQRYMGNLYYMYNDILTLGVRCLYSLVLADTAFWSMKKLNYFITGREEILYTSSILKQNKNISDVFFYISFAGCYFLAYIITTVFCLVIPFSGGISHLGVTLCCMISLLIYNRQKINDVRTVISHIILLITAFGYMGMFGQYWIFATMIYVVTSYNKRFDYIVSIALIINFMYLVCSFGLSSLGYVENILKDGKVALGYGNANSASMEILFFSIMLMYAGYYGRKKDFCGRFSSIYNNKVLVNIVEFSLLFAGTYFLMLYTKGRASIVCMLLLWIGTVIYKLSTINSGYKLEVGFRKAIDKVFLIVFVPSYIYIAITSFLSSYYYDGRRPYKLIGLVGKVFDTETIKSRLYLGKVGLMQYRPKLFGCDVYESSLDNYFFIDNFYIKAYLKYGIAFFLCAMLIFTFINYILWKKKHYYILFLLSVIAEIGFLECNIYFIMYNIFPLLLFACDKGVLALNRDRAYNVEL